MLASAANNHEWLPKYRLRIGSGTGHPKHISENDEREIASHFRHSIISRSGIPSALYE